MNVSDAKRELMDRLNAAGRSLPTLTPSDGIEAMLNFYSDVRAEGCLLDGGDMLLYQWGVFDWGEAKSFELDITRQLIGGEREDEDILQLSLTFKFEPHRIVQSVGDGNRWCPSSAELESFRSFILSSSPFLATKDLTPDAVELEYGVAG